MIEEVKKIGYSYTCSCGRVATVYHTDTEAQQICQLFPPYQGALWSDKEGKCFWCKSPTHWTDLDYEGYVCSQKCQQEIAQDVKSKSEPKPDEGRLLTYERLEGIVDRYFFDISPPVGFIEELMEAQRDLTASIVKAECQKRVERILDEIAEDFVAVVGNLYMTDKNMTLAFELWGQVKKQALKKGVK